MKIIYIPIILIMFSACTANISGQAELSTKEVLTKTYSASCIDINQEDLMAKGYTINPSSFQTTCVRLIQDVDITSGQRLYVSGLNGQKMKFECADNVEFWGQRSQYGDDPAMIRVGTDGEIYNCATRNGDLGFYAFNNGYVYSGDAQGHGIGYLVSDEGKIVLSHARKVGTGYKALAISNSQYFETNPAILNSDVDGSGTDNYCTTGFVYEKGIQHFGNYAFRCGTGHILKNDVEASDLKAQGSTSDGIILYDESITRTGFSTKSGSNGYVITGDSKVESAIAEENMQNGFLLTGNGECSGCYAKLHTTSVTDNGAGFKLASGSPTVRNSRAIDNSKGFRVNSGEVIGGYAKGNSIGYIIEAFASVYGSTATDNSYGFKINRRGYGYELRATDNYYWGIDLEPSSEETPGGFVERPTALNNGNEYTTSAGGINVASGTRVDGPGVLCNNINYAMYGNTNAYVYGTFEADTLISPNLGGYYTIEECQRVATSGPKFHYQDALPEGEGILR